MMEKSVKWGSDFENRLRELLLKLAMQADDVVNFESHLNFAVRDIRQLILEEESKDREASDKFYRDMEAEAWGIEPKK